MSRFLASSGVGPANRLSSLTVGPAASTAARPVTDARPRARKAGREAVAKGPTRSSSAFSWPAEASRFWSAGVALPATSPRADMAGRSAARKPGSRRRPAASAT